MGRVELLQPALGGLATGIGSLPFVRPAEALAMIRRYLPAIPHWPQLPRRGSAEGLIPQFFQILADMGILETAEGRPYFNTADPAWPERLTEFYTTAFAAEEGESDALSRFAFPSGAALGFYAFVEEFRDADLSGVRFLKGQLAGPLTAGLQLIDNQGRQAYYQPELRDVIVTTLAMHARWQATVLAELGRPAMLFVDEPHMNAYGSSFHITITRNMVLEDLAAIADSAHKANAVVGIHSCNAADWSLLLESDLEIVDLDVYRFGSSLLAYAPELERFLTRGGVMGWGLIPTLELTLEDNVASYVRTLEALWTELRSSGVDAAKLLSQSMITPSCGTGLLSPQMAEKIYQLTAEISARFAGMQLGAATDSSQRVQ